MNGWIKLHRKILKSDMWKSLNSKQRDVAMTILLMASYEDGEALAGKKIIKTKPGQIFTSLDGILRNCAKDVSEQNLKTAIKKLEKWGFITNESTKAGRLITVVNWEVYQGGEEKQQSKQQTDEPEPEDKQEPTELEDKQELEPETEPVKVEPELKALKKKKEPRKKNQRRTYPEEFEKFWSAYPRKKGVNKKNAYENYKVLLEDDGEAPENIIRAAQSYAKECKRNDTPENFIKHPSTFLGTDRPYVYYIEGGKPEPAEGVTKIFGQQYDENFLEEQLSKALNIL